MAYLPNLDQVLHLGARYADERTEYVIEQHPIGEVTVPTGRWSAVIRRPTPLTRCRSR
jgi:hypothetical protein